MDIINQYIAAQGRRGLSQETLRSKRSKLMLFHDYIAPTDILAATHDHVQAWADSRAHLAAGTRHNDISTLSTFYGWAQRRGGPDDPTADIERPILVYGLPRPMGDDDLADALRSAPPEMAAWLALASYAGLRCCEIARLERDDILEDHDPPLLLIRFGKGRRERVVPLNWQVLAALRRAGLPRRGRLWDVTPNQVSKRIAAYLRDIGIDATAHQARHWFGTRVYRDSGGDLRLTQDLLGHSSPATTARYAAWSPSRAVEVVSALSVA